MKLRVHKSVILSDSLLLFFFNLSKPVFFFFTIDPDSGERLRTHFNTLKLGLIKDLSYLSS